MSVSRMVSVVMTMRCSRTVATFCTRADWKEMDGQPWARADWVEMGGGPFLVGTLRPRMDVDRVRGGEVVAP
jgi:hypothetical protein